MGRDRPLVYATLGTVFNKMRRLRTAMLDALADLDADVLMTIGRDVDPGRIGSVPPNVRVEPFVSQSLVLPRASLVVSHAGLGTMLGALYHGVPMVVVSIAGDQLLNARRAAELGIASRSTDARQRCRCCTAPPNAPSATKSSAQPLRHYATNAT
jgi:MGT family glycosyltransferase